METDVNENYLTSADIFNIGKAHNYANQCYTLETDMDSNVDEKFDRAYGLSPRLYLRVIQQCFQAFGKFYAKDGESFL